MAEKNPIIKCDKCGTLINTIQEKYYQTSLNGICIECFISKNRRLNMDRETMINALIADYGEYLEDFSDEDIERIVKNGVFTLASAIEQEKLNRSL